jgi:hypothetical protein
MEIKNEVPLRWTTSMVCSWAEEKCFSASTLKSLLDNHINGRTLLSLSTADMREELGISSLSERRRLFAEISLLNGMTLLEKNEHNCEILEKLKTSMNSVKKKNGGDREFEDAVKVQSEEIARFEAISDNLREAISLQEHFNMLMFLEQADALIATRVGDATDAEARIRIREGLLHLEEEKQEVFKIATDYLAKPNMDNSVDIDDDDCCSASVCSSTASAVDYHQSNCMSCNLITAADDYSLPCGHSYCKICMTDWLRHASTDISLLPLKCCKIPLRNSIDIAKKLLDTKTAHKLIDKIDEIRCTNKMYCPNAACAAFIDLDKAECSIDVQSNFACHNCHTSICIKCKLMSHSALSSSCEKAISIMKQAEIADQNTMKGLGYQRCNQCNRFVELATGCHHMTCLCGNEFCFVCGKGWKPRECSCPLFDDQRIIEEEDREIPIYLQGALRREVLQGRVNEARQRMRLVEECDHYMKRTDDYALRKNKPRCRSCSRRLNLFGFKCRTEDGCGQNLCIGCYLHR